MNKNILWLASWYPNVLTPYDGDFIQRHAKAVSIYRTITLLHIKKDEHGVVTKDVKIVSTASGNLNEMIVFYHPVKTHIRMLDRLLSSIKYKQVYKKILKKYIKENGKPLLVHVHVALKAGLMALWLKKNFNIPYILSEHWHGYLQQATQGFNKLNIVQQKWTTMMFKNAEAVTVVSEVLGKEIERQFATPYFVLPNVVDTNIFKPGDHEKNKPVKFIHISSLSEIKNIQGIIEAFGLVKKKGYQFQLLIYGPSVSALEKFIEENDMHESITMNNEVAQDRLAAAIKRCDALILYSYYETFGCVVIEANACGVPAILSDLPVFREYIVENKTGIFALPGNPEALATAIVNFIKNQEVFDRQEIATITKNKFRYEVIGARFDQLYTSVLKK